MNIDTVCTNFQILQYKLELIMIDFEIEKANSTLQRLNRKKIYLINKSINIIFYISNNN